MQKRIFLTCAMLAIWLLGTVAWVRPSVAEAYILSKVYGATCWHGDSRYPVWDTGAKGGSIFDVHTARINYEDNQILNIIVKGSAVCYVHNRFEGNTNSYSIVEDKNTGRITVDGVEPPYFNRGYFDPAYALVKDYARSIPREVKKSNLQLKYEIQSNGSDRNMNRYQGNWYDSKGNLVLTIDGHYINGCPIVAFLRAGEVVAFRIKESDGYRDMGLSFVPESAKDFLIFDEQLTLRHSKEPQYSESIGGMYLGMRPQDLEAMYGRPSFVDKKEGAFPTERWHYSNDFEVFFTGDMATGITIYRPEKFHYDKSGLPCTASLSQLRQAYHDTKGYHFIELEYHDRILLQDGKVYLSGDAWL